MTNRGKKRALALCLSLALLVGMLPASAFAAEEGPPCENHQQHDDTCGYAVGRPCGHTEHTAACYTDELICGYKVNGGEADREGSLGGDGETDQIATDSGAAHAHTQECCALDCPHERGEHDAACGFVAAHPCGHSCGLCSTVDSGNNSGTSGQNGQKSTASNAAQVLVGAPAPKNIITGNGYSFDKSTGTLTITTNDGTTAWASSSGGLVEDRGTVTAVVLEDGVTAIGNNAFQYCTNLPSVTLPDSLTSIGNDAFSGCRNLSSVTFPDGLISIGNSAFVGCTILETADLSQCADLASIGDRAFSGCEKLKTDLSGCTSLASIGAKAFNSCGELELTSLPAGVTSIGSSAFAYCHGIKEMDLSGCTGLTSLEEAVFQGCWGLKTFTPPDNLASIGDYAFDSCGSLEAANFSGCASLVSVGNRAFQGCGKLTTVTLPDSVNSIGKSAFSGCGGLVHINISNTSVTQINSSTFRDCTALKTFVLPSGLNAIGGNVFQGCTGLGDVNLSGYASMTAIGQQAFYNCTNLTSIHMPSSLTSIDYNAFKNCAALKDLDLSHTDVASIGQEAFSNCTELQSVRLPDSLTSIETFAFWKCAALTSVTFAGNAPSLGTSVFGNTNSGLKIYVPYGATGYDGSGWSGYAGKLVHGTPVTGVTLDKTALTLEPGGTYPLRAMVKPDDASDQTVSWQSSDAAVASVDANGLVTAAAAGTATITATTTNGGFAASCVVTVNQPPAPPPSGDGGGGNSDSSGPSYYSRSLSDAASGVKLSGGSLHESARLTVQAGELHKAGDAGCDLLRSAQAGGHLLGAWDVSLSRGFRGSLTVSLPVEGRDGQTLTVAHCVDGKLTLSNVKVSGSFAKVETDSLSPFAVLDGVYTLAELEALAAPGKENPNTGAGNPFTDVKETDWFFNAVMYVYQGGIMQGTGDTTFSPHDGTTRAQLAVILWRMEGSPAPTGGNPFSDVQPDTWYSQAVAWCSQAELVGGYGGGLFGPGDPISREQLAALLYRYAQYKGWDVSVGEDTNILSYADALSVSEWAIPAVQWACGAGIMDGTTDNRLAPQEGATRAQIAAMLMRLLEKYAPGSVLPATGGTVTPNPGTGVLNAPRTGSSAGAGWLMLALPASAGTAALSLALRRKRREDGDEEQPDPMKA